MRGRYTLGDPSLLKRRFGLEEFAETDVTPRFNGAPSQDIPIVVQQPDATRELRMAKWGFVPFFMDGKPGKRPPPINARVETLATSGMFRSSVGTNRCIIPADGFYEWKMVLAAMLVTTEVTRFQRAAGVGALLVTRRGAVSITPPNVSPKTGGWTIGPGATSAFGSSLLSQPSLESALSHVPSEGLVNGLARSSTAPRGTTSSRGRQPVIPTR